MRTRTMFRGWLLSAAVVGLSCTAGPDVSQPAAPVESVRSALTGPIQIDFEDGATDGWFPFGSPTVANSTDVANTGTHSLLTTNRTSSFMGPGYSLTGQLTPGANYAVSLAAQLTAGEATTALQVTVQRQMSDGTQAFDTVVPNTLVSAGGWTTLSGNYSFTANNVTSLILYVQAPNSATDSYYIDTFSLVQAAPPPISYDFEDGTTQGWFPFGSPTLTNSTDFAFTGTHSLETTGRTASFMGPGLNVLNLLTLGATYQVTLSARMVTGQPSTTIQATVARTPTGGKTAFDFVASAATVTDQAWVTMTGVYSYTTASSGLTFYVQAPNSATASYYIDAVSFKQVAPPPGPPGNTTGASATFEDGATDGWKPRIGSETLTPTTADAHSGSYSLLTSNRTATYTGPAYDVTNVMFNGSEYYVSLWAKLAPGQPDSQLRVSLDRKLGTAVEDFHQVVGNTTVTANAWVRLQATYPVALANSQLTLYVESASGTASFYIDDFSITYIVPPVPQANIPSVFQTMAPFFPIIGAAVIPADIQGEPAVLLAKHFNSMTSGNDMKWDATEPTEGNFSFTNADAEVAFAKANGMHVRGHTLVWYNQTPAWVFLDASGNPMTGTASDQALLTSRLQNHITQVMTHFGNDVPIWDVVNEPIDPSQPDGYRRSQWFNILGPQYIPIALQAARAANPTAKLYINDYDTTNPTKLNFLVALVQSLKSAGVPIDGIGHQMHNNVQYPSPQSVINAVNLVDTTGVEQAVTEMDVSLYDASVTTPYTTYTDIPQSTHVQVGYAYSGFVQALKQVSSKIVSITIWGTSDDKSWLTSSTKVDAPLLFDPSLQAKPAYWAFVDPLQLPGANLVTKLSAAPTTVPAGQAVAYAISVTNTPDTDQSYDPTGDDLPAANVTMTMAIPAHTGFASLTPPAGWTCSPLPVGASGQVTCTIGTLGPGVSAQFALTVTLNDCSTQNGLGITASASVTSTTANPNPVPQTTASTTIVVSNPPPVITANGSLAVTVECATSYTDAGATALDACDGPEQVMTSSNVNVNAVGSYVVIYNSTDSAGGQATPVVRNVSVTDTTPPQLGVSGQLSMWPPNHEYFTFPIASLATSASDTCDGTVGLGSVVITQVTSDEANDDTAGGDGGLTSSGTGNDIIISGDCRSVQLSAERNGTGDGRVYTVTLRVTDASGNSTTKTVKVIVPHDQSPVMAVDSGPAYTVVSACH